MKAVIFSLTSQGEKIADKLNQKFGYKIESKENFKEKVKKDFAEYDALIFIMALGIVVRTIAPLIQNKTSDPAIVVLDQQGKHVISLMSGHIGGANELTLKIAKYLDSDPVITTATDIENKISFDVFAKENNLKIENIQNLKYISSAILAGENVYLETDRELYKDKMPDYIITDKDKPKLENLKYKVVISDRIYDYNVGFENNNILILRPASLVVGIGCKKNIDSDYLEQCFLDVLNKEKVSILSVGKISTIAIKENEEAILKLCRKYSIEIEIADYDKIKACEEKFESSEFVRSVTGVSSVAEGSAYVVSECGEKVCGKVKYKGVTMAIYRSYSQR